MSAFVLRVVFVVATTAIGRGIVFAFGLDKLVADIIRSARGSRFRPAIAWIMAGPFGLTMLIMLKLSGAAAVSKSFLYATPLR
jgi:hypothetical protein